MEYNPQIHHRKSIRLKYYNYTKEGIYFVTICTQNRKCILSTIIKKENCRGEVPPSPKNTIIGEYVEESIKFISNKYVNVIIDEYIIMPNHLHLIIKMGRGGTLPLQKIIRELKTYTTKKYNEVNNQTGEKLWQRNYYEHVIRNEKEFYEILEYIIYNPINWENDINYK